MRKLETYATSPWLIELHRQWLAARGKRLGGRARPFARDWNKLLEDADVRRGEDVATAEREAAALVKAGRLALKYYRSRFIERVIVPLNSEGWLRGLFSTASPGDLLANSLAHVARAAELDHPDRNAWAKWCASIAAAFTEGKSPRPFRWRSPESVEEILCLAHGLTSREWSAGTLIREASVAMGFDSKVIERRQHVAEAAVSSFFGQPMALTELGIIASENRVQLAGPLCLHFADGTSQPIDAIRGTYHLDEDLARAERITTPATRFLTVENSKTTLRRLAARNAEGGELMAACAFPTRGLRRVLELLPPELPLFHFGDTDPAGFHILAKLRSIAPREVTPWKMHRRLKAEPVPLTDYDRRLLPRLLEDPWLEDVRPVLREMLESGDKGDFEQETLDRAAAL
ncbi:Wadjet anti-phage system protein JetD domain-containing protein [Luteolibacter sp. LG18]|uniref:Wadjet anti-phage system protein JetD domain-containing protein n=1 Tax=Luteolibacter sp. LG18 TaxID=2819286 RepID=UPI002B31089A|nr:hypothetical protein llg_17630 [Luteolibacter sp. LG18]